MRRAAIVGLVICAILGAYVLGYQVSQNDLAKNVKALEVDTVLEAKGLTPVFLAPTHEGYTAVTAFVGDTKLRLFVDTGAPVTAIDPKLVTDVKLSWVPVNDQRRAAALRISAISTLTSMRIGQFDTGPTRVGAVDLSEFNAVLSEHQELPISGFLGADVLSTHSAVIDYGKALMYLRPRQEPVVDPKGNPGATTK